MMRTDDLAIGAIAARREANTDRFSAEERERLRANALHAGAHHGRSKPSQQRANGASMASTRILRAPSRALAHLQFRESKQKRGHPNVAGRLLWLRRRR